MSRTLLLRLIALMALLAFPATLRADQLRVVGFNSGFGAPGIENQVRITIEFGPSDVGPPLVSVLDIIVGTADIGRTYTLSSGPVFEAAARFLTDGENGQFGYFHFFLTGEKIGFVDPESIFFGDGTGSGRVDLAGFEITSLEFRLDDLTFNAPGDPIGPGIWTTATIVSTLTVNGQPAAAAAVPEPATLSLLGLGLAGLYAGRKTRAGRRAPPASGK